MAKKKKKKTNLIVYVDADVMNDPKALFNIGFEHMIKKGTDVLLRKKFMAEYLKAERQSGDLMKVITEWIQVRDVTTFPFRREDENKEADGRVPVDKDASKQRSPSDRRDTGHGKDAETDSGQRD